MADRPIILVGAARSGTKFVRDLLAADAGFARVPYDVNYVWRSGNERKDDDVLDPATLTPARADRIRATLAHLARLKPGDPRTMIEKTVSSTMRVPFIGRIYPQARYLHLVRDGRAVIESSMRMWVAPPDTGGLLRKLRDLPLAQWGYVYWFARNYLKGLRKNRAGGEVWGPRYPGIVRDVETEDLLTVVARQWCWSVELATRDLERIDPARVLTVRYEDLMRDPAALERLIGFVEAKDAAAIRAAMAREADASNLDKWRKGVSPDQLAVIERECGQWLDRYGYRP